MTHKLRILGLALFALLGLSAVATSAASAANFTAASYPVTFSGNQSPTEPHELVMDGYKTTCSTVEFSGSAPEASSTLTLTPKYAGCTAFGFGVTIAMNSCDYRLHLNEAGNSSSVDLVCPAGKQVTISMASGLCVAHIPPFSGKQDVGVANEGSTLDLTWTLSGITVSLTDAGGSFCPFTGNTVVNNATYNGKLTLSGSSAIHVG